MRNLKALVDEPTPPAPEPTSTAAMTRNGMPRRARTDREGQRLIAAYFDAEIFKSFKILCAEQGATTQAMVSEAMELLFKKYHKPITKELTEQAKQRS